MNTYIGSGRLVRNGVLAGDEKKALNFTIAARYGYDAENEKERVAYVPCVIFNPSENLAKLFVEKGKGIFVEFQGRIASSSFESKGATKYVTEIVVDPRTLKLIPE